MASREQVIRDLEMKLHDKQASPDFKALSFREQAESNRFDREYIERVKALPLSHFKALFDQ